MWLFDHSDFSQLCGTHLDYCHTNPCFRISLEMMYSAESRISAISDVVKKELGLTWSWQKAQNKIVKNCSMTLRSFIWFVFYKNWLNLYDLLITYYFNSLRSLMASSFASNEFIKKSVSFSTTCVCILKRILNCTVFSRTN